MLNTFRIVSLLEGISYLLILGVTLGVVSREFVFILGSMHGVLFLLYVLLSVAVSHKHSWSMVTWLLVFLAALVPFAFLLVEFFIQKEAKKTTEKEA